MSGIYLWIKGLHVLSACVLFGTGLGIAWFFMRAKRTGDAHLIAFMAREVVLADALFTATAVVVQPLSGLAMIHWAGWDWRQTWLVGSAVLYVLIGCCWLPVVWLQIQMRDMAIQAARHNTALPERFHRYYRTWFWLGWPAFTLLLVILHWMIVKPL